MLIYTEMEAAMRADDADRYAALLAEDFEYVRHKSQDTIDRDAMREPAEEGLASRQSHHRGYALPL
jgi:hypothetical protein